MKTEFEGKNYFVDFKDLQLTIWHNLWVFSIYIYWHWYKHWKRNFIPFISLSYLTDDNQPSYIDQRNLCLSVLGCTVSVSWPVKNVPLLGAGDKYNAWYFPKLK